MNLESDRLLIRNLTDSDLKPFNAYRSDERVCHFQGYEPFTVDESRKFISEHKNDVFGEPGKWVQMAIIVKENGILIGDIGLKPDSSQPRIVEFGISLAFENQGCGYAREALAMVFKELFRFRNSHRIVGVTDIENDKSIALMEALGFKKEAHFRQSFCHGEIEWRDEYLYGLLKDELVV